MNDITHTSPRSAPAVATSGTSVVATADNPDPTVTFYWRPGCGFCRSLAAGLREVDVEFGQINIWEDPEAAAFVRSVASGNEVVPTILVGATALVNPSPRQVLAALATERTTQAQPIP